METENTPTHEESLAIIASMLNNTQKSFQENSFYFLLWGWLVLAASLGQFVLLEYIHYPYHYAVWLLMPVGGIISFLYGYKQNKDVRIKSHIDSYIDYVWIAFGVSLLIVLLNSGKMGWAPAYGVIIALYGLGAFITGGILNFKPLKWGGALCWPISFITFHVDSSLILLLLALSVVICYIIPGHLLKKWEIKNV